MNFRTYWDGEPYDNLSSGTSIAKIGRDCSVTNLGVGGTLFTNLGSSGSCNGTKDTPCLSADIFGDWREELILYDTSDNTTLNIFSTVIPTAYRVPTLMHDHVYRLSVAWQNVAYNQPPHLGYYLPDYLEQFNDMSQIETGDGNVVNPDIARTDWVVAEPGNVYMPHVDVSVGAYTLNGVAQRPVSVSTTFTSLDGRTETVDENRLFGEDYESKSDAESWIGRYVTRSLGTGDSRYGNYVKLEQGGGSGPRTAYTKLLNTGFLDDNSAYKIEFDLQLHSSKPNNSASANILVLYGENAQMPASNAEWSGTNYLFKLTGGANYSTTYTVEGDNSSYDYTEAAWYHYVIVVNKMSKELSYEISSSGSVVGGGSYSIADKENLNIQGICMTLGRSASYAYFDNITVSKVDVGGELFALDYESATDASSWTAVSGDKLDITLVEDDATYGKYVNVNNNGGGGTRSAYTNFYGSGSDPYGDADVYTLEFDARIHYTNTSGSANNALYLFGERTQGSTFSVGTNYLFKMTGGSNYGRVYTVEGDGGSFTVNDPNPKEATGPWYHYAFTVDRTNRTVSYTVSLKESCGLVIASGAYAVGSAADMRIQGVYVELGKTYSFFTIDNVTVSVPQTKSDFAYTFTEPGTLTVQSSYPGATSASVSYDSEIGTKLSSLDASTFAYSKVGLSFGGLDMYAVALNADGKSVELNAVDAVPAGEAVLLRKQGDNDLASDYIYAGTMVRSATSVSGNDLKAVPEGGLTGESGDIYVLNQVNGKTGFYKLKSDGTVAYGKGYLQLSGQDVKGIVFGADELDDDTPTGINAPQGDVAGKAAVVYDLSGRRVTNPGKGIYIVNGKKVVIK